MLRWTGEGIVRRGEETGARRPQLLIFGYSCRLFRDDERASEIDQGRHLIPCTGDDSLRIDRYDARATLGPKELTNAEHCGDGNGHCTDPEERRTEKLCDQERYRALHTDEDEEEMYREEELKRLHMSQSHTRYGQVEFNYELDEPDKKENVEATQVKKEERPEDDEPFEAPPHLAIPEGMALPETKKLNTIIEKTASFIASQGTQMEILLKAKQSGNPQFEFLSIDCALHPYYCLLLGAIKAGTHKIHDEEAKEEKSEDDDHYLHPSLAPLSVELAPSIPSISYKPSADCAYSMLVNEIKGTKPAETQETAKEETPPAEYGLAPPGTETYPIAADKYYESMQQPEFANVPPEVMQMYYQGYADYGYAPTEISKAPILYNGDQMYNQYMCDSAMITQPIEDRNGINIEMPPNSPKPESKSSGLKLIHYSDSESDNEADSGHNNDQNELLKIPPHDQQVIIDKMASYVARNGNDFEQIVKMKGDPRFLFLDGHHEFNPYYKHKRKFYERLNKKSNDPEKTNDTAKSEQSINSKKHIDDKKMIVPVSFSIKKVKETEPMLPKPALRYESSEEDGDSENVEFKEVVHCEEIDRNPPKVEISPPRIVEPSPIKDVPKPDVQELAKPEFKVKLYDPQMIYQIQPMNKEHSSKSNSNYSSHPNLIPHKKKDAEKRDHDKRDYKERRDYGDKREYVERRKSTRSPSYDRTQDDYKHRKRSKKSHSNESKVNSDVITIDEENEAKLSDLIDLTQECNDIDNEDNNKDSSLQMERKKRAAAFLSSLKSSNTTPIRLHNTLASAMVKTLHTLQTKNEETNSKKHKKRSHSGSRKSKKKKSDRERSSEPDNDADSWRHLRDSYRSGRSSRDSHSKKPKKKKSSRDHRSPSYKRHRESSSRHDESPRLKRSSLEKIIDEKLKMKKLEEKKVPIQDDFASSLKELVRETRRDIISKEPIKMAVNIFSNTTSTVQSDEEWEKDSNGENHTKAKSRSDSSDS